MVFGRGDDFAGGFDFVGGEVGFGAEFGDDLTVDADLAAENELLSVAAGGDSGMKLENRKWKLETRNSVRRAIIRSAGSDCSRFEAHRPFGTQGKQECLCHVALKIYSPAAALRDFSGSVVDSFSGDDA